MKSSLDLDLHKIENNEVIPSVSIALKIAFYLEKPVEELFIVKDNEA